MSWLSDRTGIHINLGDAAKTAAKVAPLAAFIPGVGPLASAALGGLGAIASKIPGAGAVTDYVHDHPGIGDALGGALGKVGDFVTGNGGRNALGLAQGANAALLQSKANGYAQQAFDRANDSYNERAPLRAMALSKLTNPQAPDLGSLSRIQSTGSPYATGQKAPSLAQTPFSPAPLRAFAGR